MAIRTSKEESVAVIVPIDELLPMIERALMNGAFKEIVFRKKLWQFTAKYKTFKVIGGICISVFPEVNYTKLKIKTTANSDNIYALFNSPNDHIVNAFKNALEQI